MFDPGALTVAGRHGIVAYLFGRAGTSDRYTQAAHKIFRLLTRQRKGFDFGSR
jgi:hypothetical protein